MPKLTMNANPEKQRVNNSGDRIIGVDLFIDKIIKAEPFQSFLDIDPKNLEDIKADIEKNGFDPASPVDVWKKDDGTRVLIDGYTRVTAAESLGFLKVTAYERTFASEAEALLFARHKQVNRRNLSPAQIMALVESFYEPAKVGRPKDQYTSDASDNHEEQPSPDAGISAAAKTLHISESTVKRGLAVISDPEVKQQVKSGALSLRQGADKVRAKKRSATPKPTPEQSTEEPKGEVRPSLHEALRRYTAATWAQKWGDEPSHKARIERLRGMWQLFEIMLEKGEANTAELAAIEKSKTILKDTILKDKQQ